MSAATPAAVILAAGAARRFGSAKQLATYRGMPLVARAARCAIDAGVANVIVVTGAHVAEVTSALRGLEVTLTHNSNWAGGISTSIRRGLEAAPADCASALFMLADQPRISSAHLRALADEHERGDHLVTATRYAGILGVPALFASALFPELMALTGDRGAGAVIARCDAVGEVENEAASLDVDTPEQLRALDDES